MNTWTVQDAMARFSELLEACIAEGPQMVAKRGVEAAVLVPVEQWRRLQVATPPTLKQLLLSDLGRVENLTPPRRVVHRRKASLG